MPETTIKEIQGEILKSLKKATEELNKHDFTTAHNAAINQIKVIERLMNCWVASNGGYTTPIPID